MSKYQLVQSFIDSELIPVLDEVQDKISNGKSDIIDSNIIDYIRQAITCLTEDSPRNTRFQVSENKDNKTVVFETHFDDIELHDFVFTAKHLIGTENSKYQLTYRTSKGNKIIEVHGSNGRYYSSFDNVNTDLGEVLTLLSQAVEIREGIDNIGLKTHAMRAFKLLEFKLLEYHDTHTSYYVEKYRELTELTLNNIEALDKSGNITHICNGITYCVSDEETHRSLLITTASTKGSVKHGEHRIDWDNDILRTRGKEYHLPPWLLMQFAIYLREIISKIGDKASNN